jgi:hypothetical protein
MSHGSACCAAASSTASMDTVPSSAHRRFTCLARAGPGGDVIGGWPSPSGWVRRRSASLAAGHAAAPARALQERLPALPPRLAPGRPPLPLRAPLLACPRLPPPAHAPVGHMERARPRIRHQAAHAHGVRVPPRAALLRYGLQARAEAGGGGQRREERARALYHIRVHGGLEPGVCYGLHEPRGGVLRAVVVKVGRRRQRWRQQRGAAGAAARGRGGERGRGRGGPGRGRRAAERNGIGAGARQVGGAR